MICSMCEQEVDALPNTLVDKIPEHNNPDGTPHTQKICQECTEAILHTHFIDKSDDIQKNPLEVIKQ